MKQNAVNKTGFTLLELLVVVLIIGILAGIALPQYHKSVEKAKAVKTLTVLNTLANAEQRYALSSNKFSSNFNDLDINMINKLGQIVEDDTLVLDDFNVTVYKGVNNVVNTAYIRADRIKENQTLYTLYRCIDNGSTVCLDQNSTDKISCDTLGFANEANKMDPCGGNPVNDASSCNASGGYWLTASGTCYTSAQERCNTANGIMDGNVCKFVDTDLSIQNQILDYGMACYSNQKGNRVTDSNGTLYNPAVNTYYTMTSGCGKSIVNNGGICYGNADFSCSESIINNGGKCEVTSKGGCYGVTINNGGVCDAAGMQGCYLSTVNSGGECKATGYMSCYSSTINEGGICRGSSYQWGCKEAVVNRGGVCIGSGDYSCVSAQIKDGGIFVAKNSTAGSDITYSGSGCCVDCVSGYCDSSHRCNLTASEKERYCNM